MSKKGDVTTPYLVAIVLGLIALAIMGFVFRSQISVFANKYAQIGTDLDGVRKGTSCENFIEDRHCYAKMCEQMNAAATASKEPARYENAPLPADKWSDCPSTSTSSGKYCCVRIPT